MELTIECKAFEIGEEVTIDYTKPQKGTVVEVYVSTRINGNNQQSVVDAYCIMTNRGMRFVSAKQVTKGAEYETVCN